MSPRQKKPIKYCSTIRKTPDKDGNIRYTAMWEFPPNPKTGARVQRSLGTRDTWEEANALCAERAEAERKGKAVDPSKMTVAELADRWLTEEGESSVRPQTLEDYQATITNHVLPRLGKARAPTARPSARASRSRPPG